MDRRADIWAFGVILFEMLTGKQLFQGETISDTLAAVLRAEPDWDALPVDEAPALCRLIERCLERNPKQRLRDIGEARIFLQDGGASGSNLSFSRLDLRPRRPSRPGVATAGAWLLAVVALACLLAAAPSGLEGAGPARAGAGAAHHDPAAAGHRLRPQAAPRPDRRRSRPTAPWWPSPPATPRA